MKAFKSALFGTPAPPRDQNDAKPEVLEKEEIRIETNAEADKENGSKDKMNLNRERQVLFKPNTDTFASPGKGILITPGTGAARKKTVTFEKAQVDDDIVCDSLYKEIDKNFQAEEVQSVLGRDLQKVPGEASLRRTLFQAHPKVPKTETARSEHPMTPLVMQISHTSRDGVQLPDLEENGEITIDLKHPLSRSGRHWKQAYQKDHENSKEEMRKLIQYSRVVKSYAVKKDIEALDLGEKLKKAQYRVTEMESRVSQLASQLMEPVARGDKSQADQADLLSELATQTAHALRYKQKAEKYRTAIQNQNLYAGTEKELDREHAQRNRISKTPQFSTLRKDQLSSQEDIALLFEEMTKLRNAAEMAESSAASLEHENNTLKATLARVKQEMKAYEIRHQAREERRRRKDENSEAQKQALKRELALYKIGQQHTNNASIERGADTHARGRKHFVKPDQRPSAQLPNEPRSSILQESIDIWSASPNDAKPANDCNPAPTLISSRASSRVMGLSPLAELIEAASEQGNAQAESQRTRVVLQKEFEQNLKRLETSETRQFIAKSIDCSVSAQRSGHTMLEKVPLVLSDGPIPAYPRNNTISRLAVGSRANSLSGRPSIPPDRAEAAKRRIEQKMAEKLRNDEKGKENRTP